MLQIRKQIVPVNRKWPLAALIGTLRDLFPRSTAKSHPRHVLIEYVMLEGVNDSLEDAHRYIPCSNSAVLLGQQMMNIGFWVTE